MHLGSSESESWESWESIEVFSSDDEDDDPFMPQQFFDLNGNSCHLDSVVAICMKALKQCGDLLKNFTFPCDTTVLGNLLKVVSASSSLAMGRIKVLEFLSNLPQTIQIATQVGDNAHDDFVCFIAITSLVGAINEFRDWFREYYSTKYCKGLGRFPKTAPITTWLSPISEQNVGGKELPSALYSRTLSWQGTCFVHGAFSEFFFFF